MQSKYAAVPLLQLPMFSSSSILVHSARHACGAALVSSCAYHTMQSKYAAVPLLQLPMFSSSSILVCSARVQCCSRSHPLSLYLFLVQHSPKGSCVPHAPQPKHAAMPLLQLPTFFITASVPRFSILVHSARHACGAALILHLDLCSSFLSV